MIVHVKLFAVAKDIAGSDEIDVEVRERATIRDVREAIVAALPALERVLDHAFFAVDAEYADDEKEVREGSEVAVIPPVSGG